MFRSNRTENRGRPELDGSSRMESSGYAHRSTGASPGIRRKPHYGVVSRVTTPGGWKATFMSV